MVDKGLLDMVILESEEKGATLNFRKTKSIGIRKRNVPNCELQIGDYNIN